MRSEGGVETRRTGRMTPGLLVSGGAHAALLVVLLVHFARAPEVTAQPETVQVDLLDDPSNQISQGEKTAKLDPTPQRRADKVAEAEEHHPLPPTEQATRDTPSLDSPDKANDDPGRGEKPVASAPPPPPVPPERPVEQQAEKIEAPTPPARPVEVAKAEPEKPEPAKTAKPEPAKETSKDEPDAEAMAPKPPPRPKTPPKEEAKEDAPKEPPKPPHRPVEKKVAKVLPPKRPETKPEIKPEPAVVPPPRPEPPEKPAKPTLFDQVASLLKKTPEPPAPKPRAGNETKDAHPHDDFNPDKISSLLDHDVAQRRASTGRSITKASLGLPTGHAEKLSPSMAAQIDNWLIDHYRGCWSYFGLGGTQDYVPQLRITMAQDGALIGQPALINPPKDPNLRSLADSAIRAVNRCNPMEIPPRFRPYYDQGYKDRVVRFDPKELS